MIITKMELIRNTNFKKTFPELLGALDPPSIITLPVPLARNIKSSFVLIFSITLSLMLTLPSTTSPPLLIVTFGYSGGLIPKLLPTSSFAD